MNLYDKEYFNKTNRTSSSFYSNISFKKTTETFFPSFSTTFYSKKKMKISRNNNNKRDIDLYHRNYLKEQLLNNKKLSRNFFITKYKIDYSNTFENKTNSSNILNYNKYSSNSFLPIFTESEKLSNRKKPKKENLNNFLNNIKTFTKTKYIIKQEKYLLENLINNDYSKIVHDNMLLFEMKYAKNLYNIYTKTFKNYLNFLKIKYEENLRNLIKIIRKENIIRMDVKALYLRVKDLKQKLNEFKDYQYFLLKVKYKILYLKDLPDFILKKIGLSHLIELKSDKKIKKQNRFSLINLKRNKNISPIKNNKKVFKQKSLDSNKLINI
jgi:hypothetical protein